MLTLLLAGWLAAAGTAAGMALDAPVALYPPPVSASPVPSAADPVLNGRLLVVETPADTGTVVLHRVNPEFSGPIDSVRVEADGTFRFELDQVPSAGSGEILFASHRREGVLYFGQPIAEETALDSVYTVRAFPTSVAPSGGVSLPVRVRNVFVEEGAGAWQVTDLLEVVNDSSVTWVVDPDTEGAAVWRYPLPPGATNASLVDGQGSRDQIRFEDEAMVVTASLQPGERLWVVQYDLPTLETTFYLPGFTGFVEFLVREPAPAMRVEGLTAAEPIELERGSQYLRWWGEDVTDRTVEVRLGEEPVEPRAWVAVGLSVFLVLAGSVFMLRRRSGDGKAVAGEGSIPPPPGGSSGTTPGAPPGEGWEPPPGTDRRGLLLAVARLDEALEAPGDPAREARLRGIRDRLLDRLESET